MPAYRVWIFHEAGLIWCGGIARSATDKYPLLFVILQIFSSMNKSWMDNGNEMNMTTTMMKTVQQSNKLWMDILILNHRVQNKRRSAMEFYSFSNNFFICILINKFHDRIVSSVGLRVSTRVQSYYGWVFQGFFFSRRHTSRYTHSYGYAQICPSFLSWEWQTHHNSTTWITKRQMKDRRIRKTFRWKYICHS